MAVPRGNSNDAGIYLKNWNSLNYNDKIYIISVLSHPSTSSSSILVVQDQIELVQGHVNVRHGGLHGGH
jgi:peptidyl-tRNA hydrolase